MIRTILMSMLLLGAPAAATAQGAQGGGATRVDVTLSSFKYAPATITLHHGQRYVLHLANPGNGGHDFVAKEFFAAATIDPKDSAAVAKGGVDVDGGGARDIRLTAPAKGRYPVHCSHFMHSTFGMKGAIVVD